MKNLKIVFAVLFIALSCSLSAQKKVEVNGNSTYVSSKQGSDVKISGSDITKTVTMSGGNLYITGSNCNITVKGISNTIYITGSEVTVKTESVNSVKIIGSDSHVYYRTTANKNGRVNVNITGSDSDVTKK